MPRLLSLEDHVLLLQRFDAQEQSVKDKIHQRLNERCEVDEGTGCWIYTGAWEVNGQAKMRVGLRVYGVPRVAAWLYRRDFDLWDVRRAVHCSRCPNPACFNPEHLLIVDDQAEGLAVQRKQGKLGERPYRRLNPAKALLMRTLHKEQGKTAQELSVMFEVRVRAVIAVLNNETWRGP